MNRRRHDVETLLLTMFAALPLYLTHASGVFPLIVFHVVMAGIAVRVAMGMSPELIPAPIMRAVAVGYVFFYAVDAAMLSRSAIAASTHLALFIAAYQPIESVRVKNAAQRLLTTTLIFIASVATSTHITIAIFILVFALLMFRQLMHLSHEETKVAVDYDYAEPRSWRAAGFYLAGTTLIGILLFPILPRIRNPLVQGPAAGLTNATTGLSDTIDFNKDRTSTADGTVVARVWMGQDAVPFFTPLRLRGAVYDRLVTNEWRQSRADFYEIRQRRGVFRINKPIGFTRSAVVQQRFVKGTRLFLPVGTYAVAGLQQLWVGPAAEAYTTTQTRRDSINYDVAMARAVEPLQAGYAPRVNNYPVTPPVAAMAHQIVGGETEPRDQAARIETYLSTKFTYLQNPSAIGHPMSVDEFLLKQRRGHCEYFAAGMVALMTALNVPARIAGGFYGGELNPLTGYFVVRREDAHAWVEVWDGAKWMTFDPTPASLRPGKTKAGLLSAYATAISDSVNYFWDRYVLTYGLGDQIAFLAGIIASIRDFVTAVRTRMSRPFRSGGQSMRVVTIAGILAAAALAAMIALRRRRSLFDLLAAHLAALGIEVGPAMTMEEALQLLREQHPDAARELEPLIALYEEEEFSSRPDGTRRKVLRKRLDGLRA